MRNHSFTIRNYRPGDFNNYVQLHTESEQLDQSGRYLSAQGLSEYLDRPNYLPEKDLFVAEEDGKIIGYMSITLELGIRRALFDCLVHPLHRRKGAATELFTRAMLRVEESGASVAQISVPEANVAAKKLLSRLSFKFIRRFLELKLDIYNIHLPAVKGGRFKSRGLRYGQENTLTEIQNRCFTGTWGFNSNTQEEILYRLNMSGRSPEDVIMTYCGDNLVGYCWTILSSEKNAMREKPQGQIHMLGVDPDYRQKGIGQKVLLNGLFYLKRKGIKIVELTVDSQNLPACSLYKSAGFEVYARTEWYEKAVT